MTSPVEPASLSDQFEAVAELVTLNGWADRAKLEAARTDLVKSGKESVLTDKRALGRYLVERHVLTSDQVTDLDAIIQQQASFSTYQLLKKLGAGGMGTVFLAKQAGTDQILAIKTMMARLKEDRDFVGRFHRESKVLAGLTHPHIAKVFESGESGSTCYMAMEFVDGPSLGELLKDHKVLPERYVLHVARQVAEGLAFVYAEAELVHRDIKPENILISRSPTATDPFPMDDDAKLIDFGLVKPMDDDQHLTQTGMTIGTPLYMSPEQLSDAANVSARSDVWALGVVLYELIAGASPFAADSAGGVVAAVMLEEPVRIERLRPAIAPGLAEVIHRCLEKSPDLRFPSARAFAKALRPFMAKPEATSVSIKIPIASRPRAPSSQRQLAVEIERQVDSFRPPAQPSGPPTVVDGAQLVPSLGKLAVQLQAMRNADGRVAHLMEAATRRDLPAARGELAPAELGRS